MEEPMTNLSCSGCGEQKRLQIVRFYDDGPKVQLICEVIVHEEPLVSVMDDPDAPNLQAGEETLVGQLDLYAKLEETVASLNAAAEHGVVEHLFAERFPHDYQTLWERFGHVATHGSKHYTLSAYLGRLLGTMSQQGIVTHVPFHGTGRWAYDTDIGGWRHASTRSEERVTWESFAVSRGIDPQEWPATADFPDVEHVNWWAYDNWVHQYTRIHRGDCSFCQDGAGFHDALDSEAGEWLGPRDDLSSIKSVAAATGRPVSVCQTCG